MMDTARIDWHLLNWARHMQVNDTRQNYPKKAAGFVGGGYNTDFEAMCAESDQRCARAVDALIDGLDTDSRVAISIAYLVRVYRALDERALSRAKRKLGRGLSARGIY